MMKVHIALILTILILATSAIESKAEDIKFHVKGYSGKHALVTFMGNVQSKLTISPSTDGHSVRITGVDVRFLKLKSGSTPNLISDLKQVRRGSFIDLIFQLSEPADVSVSPSTTSLKVFIKARSARGDTSSSSSKGSNEAGKKPDEANSAQRSTRTKTNIPFSVSFGEEAKGAGNLKGGAPTEIKLPKLESFTSLSRGLKWTAYLIDFFWLWATNVDISSETERKKLLAPSGNNAQQEDLEKLVQDLTAEVVELRRELAEKNTLLDEQNNQSEMQ